MAEHMKSVDVDLRKVLVMPKGIDLRKFLFTSLNHKQIDPIRVIVTRSLTPVYCHNVILDAALQVKKSGVNLEWIIVGDGALRSNLESYAQKLGLTNEVKFVGRIDNQDLPKLLSTSTFYVSMPMTEGVSASLFEAMASGCYPLVTDLPGNRYWIRNDENGQLIEVNNSKMLAERLVAMVKKMNTIDLIIALNRKFIEEYASFEKNMKLISDKYHSLIEANSNA
jgi:glycosyltransferase involved in cell wall biosynthesis